MRVQLAGLAVALLVGHAGQPLEAGRNAQSPRGPGSAVSAAGDEAARFLAAARGATPVICSLAAAPLGDGHRYGGPPIVADREETLVEWAFKPTLDDRDLSLVEAGLRDRDSCVRSMAARLLAAAGAVGSRSLAEALRDERPEVRRAAAEGLGYADRADVDALVARLRDPDAGVRATAAWALGRIEHAAAVPALGDALDDPVPAVRLAAVDALGEIEHEDSIELLLPMLRSDDARIRVATARALGRIH